MGFDFSAGDRSADSPLAAAKTTFQLPAGKAGVLVSMGPEYGGDFPSRADLLARTRQPSSSSFPALFSPSSSAGRLNSCELLGPEGGWWSWHGRWVRGALVVVLIAAVVLVVIAIAAHAQVPFAPPSDQEDPKARLGQIIDNLRTWLVGFLVGLATLMGTFGGLRYLLAGGDPGEVAKAKNTLRSAAIGYGIAALAPILVAALKKIVGA